MHRLYLVPIVGLLFLAACSNVKTPNNANFTRAINRYLEKRGESCTVIGRRFPIDVPKSAQNDPYGIAPELAALEQAGLVHGSDTTVVVHGMLDAFHGSTPAQPVRRYELTAKGKQYFRQVPDIFKQTTGFCYGRKTVDSIVKWTQPISRGAYSRTEVTYTYRIVDVASWAERQNVQHVFPDIRATVSGASKTDEIATLQLTNKGWEVSSQ